MLVEFHSNIFKTEENYNKFSLLFNLFYLNRRCDFFIDKTEIIDLPIYELLTNGDRDIIDEYFNSFVTENKTINSIIVDNYYDIDAIQFTLDEALIFFNQPFLIILENSLYDAFFLNAIFENFTKRAKNIKRHLNFRWIDFVNGGGFNNIENVLNQKIDTFNNLPKTPHDYLRCFVLVDSDSKYPNEISESRMTLMHYLEENNIVHHFLVKREMENYLPDEVYDDIAENDDYIAAYKRLSPVQKDYFDIQNGFEKNMESYEIGIQDLYNNIAAADMVIFRKGGLKIGNFKSEFPKLFLSKKVTQQTLKNRVAHQIDKENELEEILDKINKLL